MQDHAETQIKGVLFDKDGTLFDFRATWGVWAAQLFADLTKGNPVLLGELSQALGFNAETFTFHPDSVVVANTARDVAAVIAGVVPGWTPEAMLEHVNTTAALVPQQPPVPLVPLLSGLRAQGLKLGVATNDAEAPARSHLDRAQVTGLFDFIAGYDSGFGAKPDTGMLIGFCEAVALRPAQVVMVGDSPHDLIAGREAGMQTFAVLTGVSAEDDLKPHADAVLKDIGGLPGWLAGR